MELAEASGISRLTTDERDPAGATTLGTGEVLRAVLDAGVRHVVLGIGGSATTDGAAGLLRALGATVELGEAARPARPARAAGDPAAGDPALAADPGSPTADPGSPTADPGTPTADPGTPTAPRVDLSGLDPRLAEVELRIACDVTNPLLGPDGAAATYGPAEGREAR